MTEIEGGSGKGRWPDMRSLGWPPEGVEPKQPAEGNDQGSGEHEGESTRTEAIPPFELAPAPDGSGAFVVVPVQAAAPAAETDSGAAADGSSPCAGGCAAHLLQEEVRSLRQAVEQLTTAVQSLTDSGGVRAVPGVGVVPVRTISDHQARHEIQEYFLRHQGETLYPAQIADALNLPVIKVAELCEALALRGQISRNAGAS